jgi:hypothetical protein
VIVNTTFIETCSSRMHHSGPTELDSASLRSASFTYLSATGPENLECLGSISSVLSSAMASVLGFQNGSESNTLCTRNLEEDREGKQISDDQSCGAESHAVDFDWLRERCDNDDELVLDVLGSFCEQGQAHIAALNAAHKSPVDLDPNGDKLLFHAVYFHFADRCG